jgi:hypothetical protein
MKEKKMGNKNIRKFTLEGSYPVFYITEYDEAICPDCVDDESSNFEENVDIEEVFRMQVNYEMDLYCDLCSGRIEAAYIDHDQVQDKNEGEQND